MSDQYASPEGRGQTGNGVGEKAFIYSVNADSHEEIEIDLGELLGVVLHWLWLIIVVSLAFGIAGYCVSRFCIAETFESTTKIYVLDKSDSSSQSTYTELQTGSQLTNDYAEIITSRAVLEDVMSDNNLLDIYTYDQFLDKVEVDVPDSTRIISITVTDTDPATAQKLANDIRNTASELILETMEIDAVNTFEEANYPTEKAGPNNSRNAIIAAILGALIVIVVVVVRYLLDDTVKTSEDVDRYLNLSTLALIPIDENLSETSGKKGKTRRKAKKPADRMGQSKGKGREPAVFREDEMPEEEDELPHVSEETRTADRTDSASASSGSGGGAGHRASSSPAGTDAATGKTGSNGAADKNDTDSEASARETFDGAAARKDVSGKRKDASGKRKAGAPKRTAPLRNMPPEDDIPSLDEILREDDTDGDAAGGTQDRE